MAQRPLVNSKEADILEASAAAFGIRDYGERTDLWCNIGPFAYVPYFATTIWAFSK